MTKLFAILMAAFFAQSAFADCPSPADFKIPLMVENITQSADGKVCTYINPKIEILGEWIKLMPTPHDSSDISGFHSADSAQGLCRNLFQNFVSYSWTSVTTNTPFLKGVWFKPNGMIEGMDYISYDINHSISCSN